MVFQNIGQRGMDICVIDDEAFYREFARLSLEKSAEEILTFASTDEFISYILSCQTEQKFRWILVDWMGPESDILKENFISGWKKLEKQGYVIIWSNLPPAKSQMEGYDGFLDKGDMLNEDSLRKSLFRLQNSAGSK